ncbi:glycosyltransferase family 4 protein [Methanobacterium sp. VT]|uniref:Glycosyltransferase family 4 protein n=2 Tax=Methanobacterium spitsbergense TaxID=2874285 RepID=A0A8T5UZS9_9EURY|nr:glycosyltransferase family 4 protein [Methanobacterium spitsbergense]
MKKKGIECDVCSPTGPDIKIGNIGKYGRISLLYFWFKVSKYFKNKKNDYDIVWLHNPLFITENPFKKCLVTIHSTSQGKIEKRIYPLHLHFYYLFSSIIDSYCIKKINNEILFTVIDPSVKSELVKININGDKIKYIPNGVNTHLFRPKNNKKFLRNKFKIPENNIVILSLGRFNEHKQPLELIRIFSKLSAKINNLTLLMAGTGELLKNSKTLVKDEELNNVRFLGQVHHMDTPNVYACSDYYIMTSKYEGQPLTLLEAMASGLKCIVSEIPNISLITDAADCGITINVENTEYAANDIINYLKSDNKRHSENARNFAVQNHDWEKIADLYLEQFSKV